MSAPVSVPIKAQDKVAEPSVKTEIQPKSELQELEKNLDEAKKVSKQYEKEQVEEKEKVERNALLKDEKIEDIVKQPSDNKDQIE